ncbi:MAG: hypothetical protein PHS17_02615 [Desulfobacterales bacterium]|nr:hypothetical protein [Desulfobacterales bacterium]
MKILMILLLTACMYTPVTAKQNLFSDGVGIASFCIVMPVGRVLLVSRDNSVAAVKFLRSEEMADGIHSEYEYFEHQKGGFQKAGEGEIMLKKVPESKGIFFHGNPDDLAGPPLRLKNFSLFATAGKEHSTVYFRSKNGKVDKRVKMAPTPWKEIGEVNPADPRIRWFAYDDKESWEVIPIDQIWK